MMYVAILLAVICAYTVPCCVKQAAEIDEMHGATLRRALDHIIEISHWRARNEGLRAKLDEIKKRRSQAISQGNRTRALKRRGALLPLPTNDIAAPITGEHRTNLTG